MVCYKGVSEEYIFSQLTANDNEELAGGNQLRNMIALRTYVGLNSKKMEEIIAKNELNPIKNKFIHFCYQHKEFIRKLPLIGSAAIYYKNVKYRKAMDYPVLDIRCAVNKDFPDSLVDMYHIMLGREVDSQGIQTYTKCWENGATNGAIAYMIAVSPEFGKRARIANIYKYDWQYRLYNNKQRIKKLLNGIIRKQ